MSYEPRELTGEACQCTACGMVFRSIGGFTRHRVGRHVVGERRCLSAPEMHAIGMRPDSKDRWMLPGRAGAIPASWVRGPSKNPVEAVPRTFHGHPRAKRP